jgi:hypothetical protein
VETYRFLPKTLDNSSGTDFSGKNAATPKLVAG